MICVLAREELCQQRTLWCAHPATPGTSCGVPVPATLRIAAVVTVHSKNTVACSASGLWAHQNCNQSGSSRSPQPGCHQAGSSCSSWPQHISNLQVGWLSHCCAAPRQAGGKGVDGKQRIMDITPGKLHQRLPLFLGSPEDIDELMSYDDVQQVSKKTYDV